MRKKIKFFNYKGKSSRLEFILVTIGIVLFIWLGASFIFLSLMEGMIGFKIANIFIIIYILISFILIYIWVITGIKRCRALKIPIILFFIPITLFIISIVKITSSDFRYYFLYKISFRLEILLIIILSIFKNKSK